MVRPISGGVSKYLLVGALLVNGCGGSGDAAVQDAAVALPDASTQELDASVVIDAGSSSVDAGASLFPPCTADAGDCGTAVRWSTTQPPLPFPSEHHGVASAETSGGSFVYLIAGLELSGGIISPNVYKYRVLADGSLSPAEQTTSLPASRVGHGVVTVSGRIYVLGGQLNLRGSLTPTSTVLSAAVQADGSLGPWRNETSFAVPRWHLGVSSDGNRIYVAGGTPGVPDALTNVASAAVGADGVLSDFRAETVFPAPRTHTATVIRNGFLYAIGGMGISNAPREDVLRASIGTDGVLSAWSVVGQISPSPVTHAAFIWQDTVFVAGGVSGYGLAQQVVSEIRAARFQQDGTLAAFTRVGNFPEPRSHIHQIPVVQGKIYVLGGRDSPQQSRDNLWIGQLQ